MISHIVLILLCSNVVQLRHHKLKIFVSFALRYQCVFRTLIETFFHGVFVVSGFRRHVCYSTNYTRLPLALCNTFVIEIMQSIFIEVDLSTYCLWCDLTQII